MPAGPRPDPPARTLRVAVNGGLAEARWTNIIWLRLNGSGDPSPEVLGDICGQVGQLWHSAFSGQLVEDLLVTDQVGVYQSATAGQLEGFGNFAGAGVAVGPSLPASVACCVSWRIGTHYRGGHPRNYLCGIVEDKLLSVTTFKSDFLEAMINAAITFHTSMEAFDPSDPAATSIDHGVVSFVDAGDWRAPPIFRRFTSFPGVDSRIDTQRRRLGPDR